MDRLIFIAELHGSALSELKDILHTLPERIAASLAKEETEQIPTAERWAKAIARYLLVGGSAWALGPEVALKLLEAFGKAH